MAFEVERLPGNPIIHPGLHPSIGDNINGPSLIRVPEWLPRPLGKYYLYFAHHGGKFIRLAYSDALSGPWKIHGPGTLRLDQTPCEKHVASPDVHVDDAEKRIIMYYHGPVDPSKPAGEGERAGQYAPVVGAQRSFVATSRDGLNFRSRAEILGGSYFRVFRWSALFYALGMPGVFYRSESPLGGFEQGPVLFNEDMRHSAVMVRGDVLYVFYSIVGHLPEHIEVSTIRLGGDWLEWRESPPVSVLLPEMEWEGGDLPLEPSVRGAAPTRVRQLRDPCIFEEGGRTYLLYSVAGESGIAIAELVLESDSNVGDRGRA